MTGLEVERARYPQCPAWWSVENVAGDEVGEVGRTRTD